MEEICWNTHRSPCNQKSKAKHASKLNGKRLYAFKNAIQLDKKSKY